MPSAFKSELDARLAGATGELLRRLEASLPADAAAIMMFYNRRGETLDMVIAQLHDAPGDVLRILRATIGMLLKEAGGTERWFEPPTRAGESANSPSEHLVNAAAVIQLGGHDRVRLWSRGGLAGELVVEAGDGAALAAVLGLVERES